MAAPDLRWQQLNLRHSAYPSTLPEEAAVAGQYVNERIALSGSVKAGRYLYVVDELGLIRLGPIDGIIHASADVEWEIKHSSLVPTNAAVRSAGYLVFDHEKNVGANAASGHYMAEFPLIGIEAQLWRDVMSEELESQGFVVREAHSGIEPIRLKPS